MKLNRVWICLAVMMAPFTALPSPASDEKVYAYDCGFPEVKPQSFTIYCADAGEGILGITWIKWSRKEASGIGTYYVNPCNPNCAESKLIKRPVSLKLSGLKKKGGKWIYTKIRFQSIAGLLPNKGSNTYSWNLIQEKF